MFSEAIYIFYGLMGGLAIVIIYFLIASVFWNQGAEKTKSSEPIHLDVAEELAELQLPAQKMKAAVERVTEVVHREVKKEAEKIQTETRRMIEEKEVKIKEMTHKYEAAEQQYRVLGKQKVQTESVVRSIAGGVVVLDEQGKVVFVNPDAEKILGKKAKDILGKPMNQMQGDHMISLVNEDGGEEAGISADSPAKKEMKESTAVIETVGGQTRGVISMLPSRTADTRIEDYKNEFLANITHELRTPLVCIQKSIATIQPKITGEEKGYLDIAIRNAQKLEKLVNEILDLSKLESGKIFLRYEILTLKDLIEDCAGSFKTWTEDKQIELETEFPKDPVVFEADKDKLIRVLTNFTANAVKFTPRRGKIKIFGKWTPEEPDKPGKVEVGVKDTGPGISADEQIRVFKKFAFISTKSTEGEPSTGLGLSISKELIELHKGRIWVESEPGRGSYFAFSVPLRKPE